jgi:phosphoglycerate dehydrogenase-like enzyme
MPKVMSSSAKIPVLCTRSFTEEQLHQLQAVSPKLKVEQRSVRSRAELAAVLDSNVEVLFSSFAPESMENLPNLRWFQSRSAGVNALMGTPVWDTGHVTITNGSGVHGITMAEYTTGMMIALARDFLGFLEHQRRSCWPMVPRVHVEQFPGRELRGSTVLVIGYGSIGREIGRQCDALGLRVIAMKRDPGKRKDEGYVVPGTGDPDGVIPESIVGPEALDEVLPQAEYVVIAAASTPSNRRLLGEHQFHIMRPDSFLINIARGDIVDEQALIHALEQRWIAGAGLDVFEKEPLPADSPLWKLDNVILSPHIAGITPRYDEHMVGLFAENLRRYVAGEPLLNVVDRGLGY